MMKRLLFIVLVFSFGINQSAFADCFTSAAETQGISEDLLRAIGKVESNYNPEALNPKSHALGVMQILPSNFKSLEKFDITEADLHQPCTNINSGAWILAGFIKQYGPVWRAVGAYGVGNGKAKEVEAQRAIYAGKVQKALIALQGHKPKTIEAVVNKTVPVNSPERPMMVVLE